MAASPVKVLAEARGLPVFQPKNFKAEEALLERKFGDAWRSYRARVRRWF